MTINVYAAPWGWLFSDLLRLFNGLPYVTATDAPDPSADRWICLRTKEAPLSPDPARTVVMVHDMDQHSIFGYGGYVFTHPEQMQRCEYDVDRPTLMRPIGADERFTLRTELPAKFTIGWVGRNTGPNKGLALLVDACSHLAFDHKVLLLGAQLRNTANELSRIPRCEVELIERTPEQPFDFETYQSAYHRMDVLAITSESEAGPLCLFEALACGVEVLSTPCGWAPLLPRCEAKEEPIGLLVLPPDPAEWAEMLETISGEAARADTGELIGERDGFDHRQRTRASLMNFGLGGWVRDCLRLAESVATR